MEGKEEGRQLCLQGVQAMQQCPSDPACSLLTAAGEVEEEGVPMPLASSRSGLPVDYMLGPPHVIVGSLKTLPSSVTCSQLPLIQLPPHHFLQSRWRPRPARLCFQPGPGPMP